MKRPLCKNCKTRAAAVNYIRHGIHHYRSRCGACIRAEKNPDSLQVPSWQKSGYKKKLKCEQCGFKAIDHRQIAVLYVDGNLRNNNWPNLKSVCANCVIEITLKGLGWVEDDVKPDF